MAPPTIPLSEPCYRDSDSDASSESEDTNTDLYQDVNSDDDKLDDVTPCKCLFCDDVCDSAKLVFDHCRTVHGFDWAKVVGPSGLSTQKEKNLAQ